MVRDAHIPPAQSCSISVAKVPTPWRVRRPSSVRDHLGDGIRRKNTGLLSIQKAFICLEDEHMPIECIADRNEVGIMAVDISRWDRRTRS